MICTTCQVEIEDGSSAIYGVERDGKMVFGWTCCHNPVGDVAVILGSQKCTENWLQEHPEYERQISALVTRRHEHDHDL